MKKLYVIALASTFFLLITSLLSCHSIKEVEYKSYKNLKIQSIGFSKSKLSVDLIYYNPNNFGLELNSTDLDIYINDNFLGHSVQNIQVTIPKRKEFSLPLIIELDMKNLLKNAINALFKDEVSIRVSGKMKVGKAGFYKLLPLEFTTKQKLSPF